MVSDLPDNWFRPARDEQDDDAGGSTPPFDEDAAEVRATGSQASVSSISSVAESPSEITADPETTGRLSLGDADDEGPVVVVGHTAPGNGGGFDHSGIRWSWLLLAAVICLVIGLVAGILVRGHNSQDEPVGTLGVAYAVVNAPQGG
ncbi:MAG: hypothetical protein LKI24_08505 [Acidipropionibacterium sp.]|nr:hypothetical protein [Acidipropionibacterium sp.]